MFGKKYIAKISAKIVGNGKSSLTIKGRGIELVALVATIIDAIAEEGNTPGSELAEQITASMKRVEERAR